MTEPAFALILPAELANGDAPPPDADCVAAYRWARGKGGYPAWGTRLRLVLTAHRYAQVVPDLLRVKTTSTSPDQGGMARFECGNLAADDSFQPDAELFIGNPANGPEAELEGRAEHPFNLYGHSTTVYTLNPGKTAELLFDVGAPRLMPLTEFTVQFVVAVNGVDQIYDLRDGDRPFTMGSLPDGGGYHVTEYLWCPGSPGRLAQFPAGPSQGPIPSCR